MPGPPYPAPNMLSDPDAAKTVDELWDVLEAAGAGDTEARGYTNYRPCPDPGEEAYESDSTLDLVSESEQEEEEEEAPPEAETEAAEDADLIAEAIAETTMAEIEAAANSPTLWEDDSVEILENVADDLDFVEAVEAAPPEPQQDYLTCTHCYGPYQMEDANDHNLCVPCWQQQFLYS